MWRVFVEALVTPDPVGWLSVVGFFAGLAYLCGALIVGRGSEAFRHRLTVGAGLVLTAVVVFILTGGLYDVPPLLDQAGTSVSNAPG